MKRGDILVFKDRTRGEVYSCEAYSRYSDLFSGEFFRDGRRGLFWGLFIRGRSVGGRVVWVQH